MDTVAGRGGKVYKVTNLNASGAGSLKACASDADGPRVCVFEVSGTIRITTDMMIRNGNLTIAGQTAPSPGIMIRGAALRIQASDILVQHIRVRAGDDPNGPDPDNRDSLKIEGSDCEAGQKRRHRSLLLQLGHRRDRQRLGLARQHHVLQQHLRRAAQRIAAHER